VVTDLKCEEVWREVSNYIDGDVTPELRARIDSHVRSCKNCAAVLNGARNVVEVSAEAEPFGVPRDLSRRIFRKFEHHVSNAAAAHPHGDYTHANAGDVPGSVPLGITDDAVPLGSHLLYFWQNDDEFARGVRFLEAGLNSNDHCVLQGHDEVNTKALAVLDQHGFDSARLIGENRLTVLGRRAPSEMLTDMAAVFESARRMGAKAIRYLGNLGVTGEPMPGVTETDICNLEAKTTSYISRFPCVLVCMYDVRSLPGRMIVNCGLRNHPHTIGSDGVQENPHYMPPDQTLPGLRHIQ
jgi:hypothetical protein